MTTCGYAGVVPRTIEESSVGRRQLPARASIVGNEAFGGTNEANRALNSLKNDAIEGEAVLRVRRG